MCNRRTFLLAVAVLAVTSVANADLILTLNGLDTAKEPVEIKGKNNLVIAVAGDTKVDPDAYSVTATGGVLEPITEPNAISSQAEAGEYLFTFQDESTLGIISLIANEDMIIDDIPVLAEGTIYELNLFCIPERDTVIPFGIDLEALSYVPPEPEEQEELHI